ncbi:zinc finger SWIM domain-containing protein 7-like isoform X4 [Mytilus edulis]|uniref:zinc finger SWIM domain-containing protein 7-like isoform X4 n=1 Tax=Mytilus edulis TaxID=6550 RepID=UPI0039EF8F78
MFSVTFTGDVIKSVGEELWKEVENAYTDSGKITDEILSALSFVYQSSLLPALDLVDHRNVSHMTSPSGRSIYQVIGSSGTPYTCFTTSFYCSCPAFRYSGSLLTLNLVHYQPLVFLSSVQILSSDER